MKRAEDKRQVKSLDMETMLLAVARIRQARASSTNVIDKVVTREDIVLDVMDNRCRRRDSDYRREIGG
jgi:hypothetical protein